MSAPTGKDRVAAASRARQGALNELLRRHAAEFSALHDAARQAEGLEPIGTTPDWAHAVPVG